MTAARTTQTIELDLPADVRHVAIARVVAAATGAEVGLTIDDIEDLRLGVNELVSILVEHVNNPAARVTLRCTMTEGRIEIEGRVPGLSEVVQPDELTSRIISAVLDEVVLVEGGFRLVRSSTLGADR